MAFSILRNNDNLDRNLRQDIEDLKAKNEDLAQIVKEEKTKNEELAQIVKEEKAKNLKARKRLRQFVIDSQLSKHVMEKNLNTMRGFILRNHKRTDEEARLADSNSDSEYADAVEFLSPKKPLKVDIEFANIFSIKTLVDEKLVVDVLALRENIVAVCFSNEVQLYLLDDQKSVTKRSGVYKNYIQLAAYDEGKSFVILSRTDLTTRHITDDLELSSRRDNLVVQAFYRYVSAMTCLNASTLAFASASRIMVGTKQRMHKIFERYPGFSNSSKRPWCPPILDMCFLRDDFLVFCNSTGVHRLNPFSGTFTVFSDIKTIVSMAAFKDSYFFALDSATNRLLMFGPGGRKPSKTWSVDSQLRSEDQLLRISVCKDRLVCVTKFGFVVTFTIKCEEKDD